MSEEEEVGAEKPNKKKGKNRNTSTEPLKYLVNKSRGEDCVIEVPANWKMTFSSVNPQSNGGRSDGYCLRIYEGTKLRSVIGDVTGFRELSMPFARKVSSETGNATWSKDSSGNFARSEEAKVDTKFQLEPGSPNPFEGDDPNIEG